MEEDKNMKVEENNIQTFCGKDLFKWESWDELDAGTLQFYGVEFCIDYLKNIMECVWF